MYLFCGSAAPLLCCAKAACVVYLELHDEMCEVELRFQVESDADVLQSCGGGNMSVVQRHRPTDGPTNRVIELSNNRSIDGLTK